MIKIVDFATSFDAVMWNQFQQYVITTNDDLKYNYIDLDPQDYVSFPVVIINNIIVCFSALQTNSDWWGTGIGRVSTRMWIHPDYRHSGKFTSGPKFFNTTYCLPLQLAKAKLIGLDCVFISRGDNLKGFEEYLKLVEINCNTRFTMKPNKYSINGPAYVEDPNSMKQWVMLHHLTNQGEDCWNRNMEKYVL